MKFLLSISLALIGFNFFVWVDIARVSLATGTDIYFLNVGQGDSSLINFADGTRMLTDGGKDKSVLFELDKILPNSRTINLVMVTHPQLDHFGGLIDVIDRFKIGAFIYNGEEAESDAWIALKDKLKRKNIKTFILDSGDVINYKNNKLFILSPDRNTKDKDLNENSMITLLESEGIKALFTGDIGDKKEAELIDKYNLDIDVLKVPHHGSKYSSSAEFLKELTPSVSVVQVGKNSYGHPNPSTLKRIASVGSSIYRNDSDGIIRINIDDGLIKVFK